MKEAPRQAEPDFLGRLVDKALGRSDPVVPRLFSVFEPLQPLGVQSDSEWEMSAQPREEVEAGFSRTVAAGGEPDTSRFDPPRDDAQRGAAQVEGEAGRRRSATLAPSPHPITSVGETQALAQPVPQVNRSDPKWEMSAQPRKEVEADARGQRKSAHAGTIAPEPGSSRAVTVGGEPDTLRFDPPRDDAQRDAVRAEAEAGRHISAALVASPHPLTSAGEAETSAQPGSQVNRNDIVPAAEPRGKAFSAALRPAPPDFVDQGALAAPARKDKGMITDAFGDRPEHPVIAGAMVPKAQSILKLLPTRMRISVDRQPPSSIQEVETEPVINITIGRIEVRAVAEDSKTSRRSHESRERKPMSLDEYLKQRGGGR